MNTTPLLILGLLLGVQHVSLAREVAPPPVKGLAAPKATAQSSMTFAEALEAVSQKYTVAIVADAYAGEESPLAMPDWQGLSAAQAIRLIAQRSERDVIVLDGIYVLRHKRWAAILKDMIRRDYPLHWNSDGTIKIARLDKPTADESLLPARSVEIAASDVSCSRFVSELRSAASLSVRITSEIGWRRLHVYAKDVMPSTILGCVAFLVNAGPEVVLRPSKAQQAMEEEASVLLPDFLKKRLKESERLRADLEKGLTEEQRRALMDGRYVPLTVNALPKGLQERALEYIKLSASLNSDLVPSPDMSRWKSFQIRFRPVQSGDLWRMLGVVTADMDGNEYVF